MAVGPLLRGARAAVFTVVCVTLSALGHQWMSGHVVAAWALGAAAAVVFALAFGLAGRLRRFPWIAALMLAGQAGLHVLFDTAPSTGAAQTLPVARWLAALVQSATHGSEGAHAEWGLMTMPDGSTMPAMPGMGMGVAPGGSGAGMAMPGMSHGPWGMIAAHAVVGLVCAWWLARGESTLFGLLSTLIAFLFAPVRLAVGLRAAGFPRTRRAAIASASARCSYSALLAHCLVRRGPPRVAWI